MDNPALTNLYADKDLILNFLATFSKFEYALKVSGYYTTNRRGEAKADWPRFTKEVSNQLNIESSENLKTAFNFILKYPLQLLGEKDGKLDWILFDIDKIEQDLDKVIFKIKQIRNNTFHGGKFLRAPEDEETNSLLLKHSITTLLEIKNLSKKIRSAFES